MKKLLLFPLLLLASPAVAEPFTYTPKDCEFQITFPEKPFTETKCNKDGKTGEKSCTDIVSFTKAVGKTSSTNFRISCSSVAPADIAKFTPEIIEATLKEVVKASGYDPLEIHSDEDNGYKNASTISFAVRNDLPVIYNGQIWMGKKSMFTLEAEMRGEPHPEVEKTFAEILRSAHPNDVTPAPLKNAAENPKLPAAKTDAKKQAIEKKK